MKERRKLSQTENCSSRKFLIPNQVKIILSLNYNRFLRMHKRSKKELNQVNHNNLMVQFLTQDLHSLFKIKDIRIRISKQVNFPIEKVLRLSNQLQHFKNLLIPITLKSKISKNLLQPNKLTFKLTLITSSKVSKNLILLSPMKNFLLFPTLSWILLRIAIVLFPRSLVRPKPSLTSTQKMIF